MSKELGGGDRTLLSEAAADRPRSRFGQAMAVALGFYCSGHLMDLAATLGRLGLGSDPGGVVPGWVWRQTGMFGLVALKVLGAAVTAWIFWRLRDRLVSLILVCLLAVVLLYAGSLNVLALFESLGGA